MHAHRTSDTVQVPREAHAQRELAAALAGHHGRGVQAEVRAASQRAA